MTTEQIVDLAADLGRTPTEIVAAIALVRTGRTELIGAVVAGRMTLHAALAAAREGKKD